MGGGAGTMLAALALQLLPGTLSLGVPTTHLGWEGRGGSTPPPFRFAKAYGNHMVLEAAPRSASVWGFAPTAGATVHVTVSAADSDELLHAVEAVAGPDLAWKAFLPPVEAGQAPHKVTAALAAQGEVEAAPIVLEDVLFGSVWVCGGQRAAPAPPSPPPPPRPLGFTASGPARGHLHPGRRCY